MESGGDLLLDGRIGQQVAGNLLDGELVERHIAVEGVDHPVAIAPGVRPGQVFFVAVAIGVTRQIQPLPRPFFAIVRGEQQTVHKPLVRVGTRVGEKRSYFLRSGRQASEIETHAPDQRDAVGFGRGFDILGFELRQHKRIDGFLTHAASRIAGTAGRRIA